MNTKQYITPRIMTLELETMSIIAASLNRNGTSGNFDDAKPATGGTTSKHTASRTYFNSWENEDDMDDYDY